MLHSKRGDKRDDRSGVLPLPVKVHGERQERKLPPGLAASGGNRFNWRAEPAISAFGLHRYALVPTTTWTVKNALSARIDVSLDGAIRRRRDVPEGRREQCVGSLRLDDQTTKYLRVPVVLTPIKWRDECTRPQSGACVACLLLPCEIRRRCCGRHHCPSVPNHLQRDVFGVDPATGHQPAVCAHANDITFLGFLRRECL